MSRGHVPPQDVQRAAALGLALRRKHGRGGITSKQAGKEGIGSGVQRAVSLSNGKRIPIKTLKRMVSFFARHSAYKHKHKTAPTGAARISWLLWGGDAGRRWAKAKLRQHEARNA